MSPRPRGASADGAGWSIDTYRAALRFAAAAHGRQKVPGQDWSYIVHVTAVCGEILNAHERSGGFDADLAVACALLHDTIEDTGVSRDELTAAFGERVARGVSALSKDPSLPHLEAMKDSIRRILAEPPEIAMVKMADRIVNLDPPPSTWSREKIDAYREEARLIHRDLGHHSPYLARRLASKIRVYGMRTAAKQTRREP